MRRRSRDHRVSDGVVCEEETSQTPLPAEFYADERDGRVGRGEKDEEDGESHGETWTS